MRPYRPLMSITAILFFALSTCAEADEPVRLRVLSYNIHHGRGMDDVVDLNRIAEVINEVRPDVVALQEVDRGVERSGRIDEPAELARLTGTEAIFERNIPYQGGDYGNAMLTRLPIVDRRNVHLPSFYKDEQRGCLVVDLTAPGHAGTIRVFATHLDYRPPDGERLASASLIETLAAEENDRPMILMGDLNAQPDSAVLQKFDETWTRTNTEPMPTFPVAEPTRQIDYILVRPSNRWRVVEVRVLDEKVASDHRPIFAVLELIDDSN